MDKALVVGTVTDKSGAIIPNALITVREISTNATFQVKTNASGFYTSPELQIGTYEVTAEMHGFVKTVEQNIILDVGVRKQVDFSLGVGSANMEVTVTGTPPILDTTSGTVGYVIDQRTIEDLPLNGGNALALAALVPGVVNAFGADVSGFNDRGSQLSSIRIGGGAVGAYALTLDGANNQITMLGEIAINPQSDSVAQFRLYSGSTPAQFGFTSGGAIDIATRAGGNALHGTIYEYLRNDVVDAQNFFSSPLIHKPELRYNRFGGSISGPILHDKMFYFGNAERYELVQTNPQYTTVPTALERAGDFSQSNVLVGSTCTPAGIVNPTTKKIYDDSKIPTADLDQSALAIQKAYYPLPNNNIGIYNSDNCSKGNNYVGNAKLLSHQQLLVGRLDYQATKRDGFFLRYGYYSFATNNDNILPDPAVGARYDTPVNQMATFGYTRVISPNTLNDLRITGLRAKFLFNAGSFGKNIPASLGISNIPSTTVPYLSNGMVEFSTTIGYRSATQFQVVDTVTSQVRNHSLNFGVDLRFNQSENNQNTYPSGLFNFSKTTTSSSQICFPAIGGSPAVSCTGNIYASFLLGTVASAYGYVVSPVTFRSTSGSGFLQDDWRASSGLTLNLGVRYDYQAQPYEIRNRTANFDPSRGDAANGFYGATVYAGQGGYGSTFNKENYADFSPRIGFAYHLPHLNNTYLRGGYSIYYSSTANVSFTASTNGFGQTGTTYSAATVTGSAFLLENGFPSPPTPTLGSSAGPAASLGSGVFYQEPVQKTPMSQVFTLTVSQPLKGNFVAEATYLGNTGRHFVQPNYDMNQLDPSYYSAFKGTWPDPLQTQVTNPYAGLVPGTLGGAKITQFNLDKPYPYYSDVSDYQPRNGSYFGNFGYLTVQRRAAKGFQIIGAYTFGKLISDPIYVPISSTNGSLGINTGSSSSFQNSRDRRPEHTVDTLDITHRFSLSLLSRLPFGKDHRLLNSKRQSAIFGNLNFNTIVILQSGTPLAITGAENYIATRPNFSGVNPHSDCHPAGGGTIAVHTQNCWFNSAAFVNPPDYQFGNVPRVISTLRGPGAFTINASLQKNFKLENRFNLQLRLEGFNILNHPNLSNPVTSFGGTLNQGQAGYSSANSNGNFGKIITANPARILQAGMRISF